MAVSRDGTNWTGSNQTVLSAIPGTWESNQISRAGVLRIHESLWMWYKGMGGGNQQVGLAQAPYPSTTGTTPTQPSLPSTISAGPDPVAFMEVAIVSVAGAGSGVAVFAPAERLVRQRQAG